jgi:hypothetical protein
LSGKRWSRRQARDNADLWASPDDGRHEIVLPRSTEFSDYPIRIAQLLDVLGELEQRSPFNILRDINTVGLDILRLRAPETDAKLNSIPLKNGVRLIDYAMELISAAALSAVERRRVFPARRPRQALEYLKSVELGQSEEGSYILTFLSKLEPQAPELFEVGAIPFARRVTRTLATALQATSEALTVPAEEPPAVRMQQRVEAGVSANLCEALAGMLDDVEGNPSLELHISWGRAVPEVNPPGPVRFLRAHAEQLAQAARLLRAEQPEIGLLITGVVIDLHREPGRASGDARVSAVVNGRVRNLHLSLAEPDYEIAIDAHRDQRGVLFHADIERVGRRWRANNVVDFQVVG